jgi:hypothetical protein
MKAHRYFLEERTADGTVANRLILSRDPAETDTDAAAAWRRFQHEIRTHPGRYNPHAGLRLVLVDVSAS